MLQNYFKVAIRSLIKQRFYSAINVMGFSIGLAVCLLIVLYVADELSYDKMHSKADRTFRVYLKGSMNGQSFDVPVTCPPFAATVAREFPEVETATRIFPLTKR